MELKEGDIVSFGGVKGIVKFVDISGESIFSVVCNFEDESMHRFTSDGRLMKSHTEPLLKFIERPKKKVKKTFYTAIFTTSNINPINYSAGYLFETKELCIKYHNFNSYNDMVQVVPIEIEVLEDKYKFDTSTYIKLTNDKGV